MAAYEFNVALVTGATTPALARWTSLRGLVLAVCLGAVLPGCGGGASNETADTSDQAVSPPSPTVQALPASLSQTTPPADVNDSTGNQPAPGSPELILREITQLLVQPLPKTDDVAAIQQFRTDRNRQIIQLATEAIAMTHGSPETERLFTVAVHHLMEARLQEALSGDTESIDSLYADADSLYQRAPKSEAAAEAAYQLVKFANVNANRFADKEPRWLQEFSNQSRLFAEKFPHEARRGVGLLMTAGESCELNGMAADAIACYQAILDSYPDTPQVALVEGILRRLDAVGKPLSLAGPTFDGGFWKMAERPDHVRLVVFWASGVGRFENDLPALKSLAQKYAPYGLETVGINLDRDPTALETFVKENAFDWPQIFYSNPEQRGWDHPIALYYGIRSLPSYWLVDKQGNVAAVVKRPTDLDEPLAKLMSRPSTQATSGKTE